MKKVVIGALVLILVASGLWLFRFEVFGVQSTEQRKMNGLKNVTSEGVYLSLNDVRREHGLQQFERSSLLDKSAEAKCEDMVDSDYFEHTNPTTGKRGVSYIADLGLRHNGAAENLISGVFGSSKEVVDDWMKSDSHRVSILDPKYVETGVALCHVPSTRGIVLVNHFIAPLN